MVVNFEDPLKNISVNNKFIILEVINKIVNTLSINFHFLLPRKDLK